MNFDQYQQQALTTLNPKLTREEVIYMCTFGIVGETGEITDYLKKQLFHMMWPVDVIVASPEVKQKMCDELGDLTWYIAILSHTFEKRGHIDAEAVAYDHIEDELFLLAARVGDLCETIRLEGVEREKSIHAIQNHLGALMESVVDFSSFFGLNLYTIMEYNVEKLKARHPEGFTHQYTSDSTRHL